MTALRRVRSVFSGFPGGPGISTHYFLDTDTAVEGLRVMWEALNDVLPTDVTIQVENVGDEIESTTGELLGTWPASDVVLPVSGDGVGVYAAPVGSVIDWLTDTVLDGHRVRGRTFVVPLVGSAFEANGSINSTALGQITTAASNFQAGQISSFVIWHRPRAARAADGSRPAVTARVGGHALVTSVRVPDKAAVLRSRRD